MGFYNFLDAEVGWNKKSLVRCMHHEVAAVFKWDHEISEGLTEASWV